MYLTEVAEVRAVDMSIHAVSPVSIVLDIDKLPIINQTAS